MLPTSYQFNKTKLRRFQCFAYLFSKDIEENIVTQTMLDATQNENANFKMDCAELRRFIGIIYLMSVCILPSTRDYWGTLKQKKN